MDVSASESATRRDPTVRRSGIVAAALALILVSTSSFGAKTHDPIDAVWHSQELRLTYRAYNTSYTCKDLVSRVTAVLRAVGAREDVRVASNCADFSSYQLLNITLATPVEATAANVQLVTTFDPSRRLLAQLRQESLPTPADVERFAATRRAIRLTKTRQARFTASDCALMQSISEQLFPKLEVRVLKGGLGCANQGTAIQPSFTVEALVRDEPAAAEASSST